MRTGVTLLILTLVLTSGARAQTADPFESLDLGVAPVSDGRTQEYWVPLAESGVKIEAYNLIVKRNDAVDGLLIQQGIRPDEHARGLIAMLNPDLDAALTLSEGQNLTFIRVVRPSDATSKFAAGTKIALIVSLKDRRRALEAVKQLRIQYSDIRNQLSSTLVGSLGSAKAEITLSDIAKPARGYGQLALWNKAVNPGEMRTIADQLENYNGKLSTTMATTDSPATPTIQATAAAAAAQDGRDVHTSYLQPYFAAQPRRNMRDAQLMVHAMPADAAPCHVGWSLYGFQVYPGSRQIEDLPVQRPIPVFTANLAVWIEKDGRMISAVAKVDMEQLVAAKPNAFQRQLQTTESCSP